MSMTFGKNLKMTVKGGSHDAEISVTLRGFPAGVNIDEKELQEFVSRRSAANNVGSTARHEPDEILFDKGVVNGVTDGGDIVIRVENKDVKKGDYDRYDDTPRPSHADYVSHVKYGKAQAGGGMFSGRVTLPYCIAGGIAKQYLNGIGINVYSFISRIGNAERKGYDFNNPERFNFLTRELSEDMEYEISAAAGRHDSVGGEIDGFVTGLPVGIGEPLFGGLEARLASLLYSIPAVKGVEFGRGFGFTEMCGSAANDSFIYQNDTIKTASNYNGGINGGISNGMPLVVKVAVKPTPSIGIVQNTVSLKGRCNVALEIKGRHDTCIVPRAAVVVEAAMAYVVMDLMYEGGFLQNAGTLAAYRDEINGVDEEMAELLKRRMDLSAKIGEVKKAQNLPTTDKKREGEIIDSVASNSGIEKEDVKKIYDAIFELSKKRQK